VAGSTSACTWSMQTSASRGSLLGNASAPLGGIRKPGTGTGIGGGTVPSSVVVVREPKRYGPLRPRRLVRSAWHGWVERSGSGHRGRDQQPSTRVLSGPCVIGSGATTLLPGAERREATELRSPLRATRTPNQETWPGTVSCPSVTVRPPVIPVPRGRTAALGGRPPTVCPGGTTRPSGPASRHSPSRAPAAVRAARTAADAVRPGVTCFRNRTVRRPPPRPSGRRGP
jgi:hypothetical protein